MSAPAGAAVAPGHDPGDRNGPLSILVADDAPDARTLVRLWLEGRGLSDVVEAADGAEAVALAERFRPGLVLLDVAMPRAGGLEAAAAIRARLPDTRIVVLSGRGADATARRAIDAGADAYLEKSATPGPLFAVIDELCPAARAPLAPVPEDPSAPLPATPPGGPPSRHDAAELLEAALVSSPVGITLLDRSGRVILANAVADRLLGGGNRVLDGPASSGRRVHRLGPAALAVPDHLAVRMACEGQAFDDLELFVPGGADGMGTHVRISGRPVVDRHGSPIGAVISAQDDTARRRAEQLLEGHGRVLELIARGTPLRETLDAVVSLVEDRCPGARAAVMLVEEGEGRLRLVAAPGLPPAFALAIDASPVVAEGPTFAAAARTGRPTTALQIATHPGWAGHRAAAADHGLAACWAVPVVAYRTGTVLGSLALYFGESRGPTAEEESLAAAATSLAAIAVERDRAEGRLQHQALHDSLTGLANRALFLDRLGHALSRAARGARKVAVVFLDLDRFKMVNDSRGHAAGDRLLLSVARRLERAVRPGDTVARFGGDEFAVLCEEVAVEADAVVVAQRILDALVEPVAFEGGEAYVTASVGIAFGGPAEAATPDIVLRNADAAMYRAKERGRARWEVFDEGMSARATARLDTETALRRAVTAGELRVFYQPQVTLAGGDIVGAEALVRWEHPARGLLPPAEFILLAEESELIVAVGAAVLREACRDAAGWTDAAGGGPLLSVNVSARQLGHPELAATVRRALEDTGLRADRLCLEVTETVLMEEADAVRETVRDLAALGVGLAIDDFGTGYSSLSYLRHMPVESVKIDTSFVHGLGEDRDDDIIVGAIVHLANDLGLRTVAEGVETEAQHQRLLELGCTLGQGYRFGRPMPALAFTQLLRSGGAGAIDLTGPAGAAPTGRTSVSPST